jgi:hypothetical protein
VSGGQGYSIGDHVTIGEDVQGWVVPAVVTVTSVDDTGGITSAEIFDGGKFVEYSGNEQHPGGSGQYNLGSDTAAASLLRMAQSSSTQTSATKSTGFSFKNLSVGFGAGAGVGAIVFAIVAIVLKKRAAATVLQTASLSTEEGIVSKITLVPMIATNKFSLDLI